MLTVTRRPVCFLKTLPLLLAALTAGTALARLPADAPPRPPVDTTTFTVVEVSTAQALADACWNLQSNQAIVIAPGTYDLASVRYPNGVDGRLAVGRYNATPISNIQLRGATGDPNDVILVGAGPLDPIVPFGIQIFTATDLLIADLSIHRVYYHAVQIAGEQGATRVRLSHLRLYDAGQQIVKGTGDPDDVIIEFSEIFHSAGADHHPEGPGGGCYTNGIDATGGARWIIRDNLIHGIYCQDGTLAGPSILMWQGVADTLVERNTILNSARGVSFGLNAGDHSGGIIRNNFIRMDPAASYARDVGIYTTSPGSIVAHNTVLLGGAYPNAIEVRFASATGVRIENNLMDAAIRDRGGASSVRSGNLLTASAADFVDPAAGDLHLLSTAAAAIDARDPLAEVVDDFDGQARPGTAGAVDVGADEEGLPAGGLDGGSGDAGGGPDAGALADGGAPDSGGADAATLSPDAGSASPDPDAAAGCSCTSGARRSSIAWLAPGFLLLLATRRVTRRVGRRSPPA